MPSSNNGDRIDRLLLDRVKRSACPIVRESNRFTKCTCLRDLLKEHRQPTVAALSSFLASLEERSTTDARTNHARRHLFDVARECSSQQIINKAKNPHYCLPVPGSVRPTGVVLCRSAMVDLSRSYLHCSWSEAGTYYTSMSKRNGQERKDVVHKVLRYLLLADFAPGHNIAWSRNYFTELGIPKDTAKKYVREFDLRQIASQCVRCVSIHSEWVRSTLGGCVVVLGESVLDQTIPFLVKRGDVNAEYRYVDPQSVARDPSFYSKRVQYRKIDPNGHNDAVCAKLLEDYFKNGVIAKTLAVPAANLVVEGAFLRSMGHALQTPHIDFSQQYLHKYGKNVLIGLIPLTVSGSYLQVWPKTHSEKGGYVLYIPFGTLLLIPGDTVHGGGFQSSAETKDLRLHMYVYINIPGGETNQNIYQSTDKYPMNVELQPGGLLHTIFRADEFVNAKKAARMAKR